MMIRLILIAFHSQCLAMVGIMRPCGNELLMLSHHLSGEHGSVLSITMMLANRCHVLSITSFNEWGEGTQIEPSRIAESIADSTYVDYGDDPFLYLNMTLHFAKYFEKSQQPDSTDSSDSKEL